MIADRLLNILQRFLLSRTLRPAARQTRARDCEAFLGGLQGYTIDHGLNVTTVEGMATPKTLAKNMMA